MITNEERGEDLEARNARAAELRAADAAIGAALAARLTREQIRELYEDLDARWCDSDGLIGADAPSAASVVLFALTDALALAEKSAETLWAVHVAGPDDVLAMPDKATAEGWVEQINLASVRLRQRLGASPLDVYPSASVVEWDGTAEEHAGAWAEFVAEGCEYTP